MNNKKLWNILNKELNKVYLGNLNIRNISLFRVLNSKSFSEIVKTDNEGKNKFNIQITENCSNVNLFFIKIRK